MRIVGAVFLILGLLFSFSIDDWEVVGHVPMLIGFIPMDIGIVLLAIAEKRAPALATEVVSFKRHMDKRTPPPSQNRSPIADAMPLNSDEVLQLLDELNRSSRAR
jgi:hypothetical protein